MSTLAYSHLDTPLGWVRIEADDQAITAIGFVEATDESHPENDLTRLAADQLAAYFKRDRTEFDLPLAPKGTDFQRAAWQALRKIPYGETRYYAQQADLIGRPSAIRAIGAANGANPIAIVVPCHRVIGKNGSLTGYAGGLDKKEWLLAFEQGGLSQEPLL
ncbi:methylated-DNA--[protein]-cysteine S-methyltransferase [Saccharospirillum salsuginis]|uniref:Methylated-DNA--protein-cysteine methyltransferase n=1 Tax=Saccharospirillum salsuginis TaxID=418750 RepID=A0A918NHS3_9GAMM|nr:methylated-DNA--[protein]-cysteine S-methyltransferase [Saccharospirillum salsuginis]GGX71520.1 methylated-DNA--protein-cysteine methyltransferase [Saccharospirillum salsuginis]